MTCASDTIKSKMIKQTKIMNKKTRECKLKSGGIFKQPANKNKTPN